NTRKLIPGWVLRWPAWLAMRWERSIQLSVNWGTRSGSQATNHTIHREKISCRTTLECWAFRSKCLRPSQLAPRRFCLPRRRRTTRSSGLRSRPCSQRQEKYSAGFGQVEEGNTPGVLIPEIDFYTNDAVPMLQGFANGNSFPILLSDRYSKGIIYILTIPDNFNDLYSYPVGVVSAIKNVLTESFPVRMDGPSKVSLFAYDNHAFVVESYLDHPTTVTVSITGGIAKITNMETGDTITGQASTPRRGYGGR